MKDKVIVITGITKGIGKELAKVFLAQESIVCGFSRTEPQDTLSLWVQGDLTCEEDRKKLFETVLQKYGKVDVLINNAGLGHYDTWEDTPSEELRKLFELNFFSLVALTQLFSSSLKLTKGAIVNVSSIAGKLAVPCMGPYCATKFAVNAFSDSLRIELKPYGVHILNLVVGRINTGFSSRALGKRIPPVTPGAGSPQSLALKTYSALLHRKREITYPSWYPFFLQFVKLFPGIYSYANIKKWNLGK